MKKIIDSLFEPFIAWEIKDMRESVRMDLIEWDSRSMRVSWQPCTYMVQTINFLMFILGFKTGCPLHCLLGDLIQCLFSINKIIHTKMSRAKICILMVNMVNTKASAFEAPRWGSMLQLCARSQRTMTLHYAAASWFSEVLNKQRVKQWLSACLISPSHICIVHHGVQEVLWQNYIILSK